jgi:ferredoxin
MILYFSGTGNSRYAAQAIGTVTGDKIVSLNELLKSGSKEALQSDEPFVFVCPTYAWRLPKIVEDFIRATRFSGSAKAYFVLTCGSETGNAVHYAKKICHQKGFDFLGLATVIMPENYIAMFATPDKTQADEIIQKAAPQILAIAERIQNGQPLPEEKITAGGRFRSTIMNPLFYLACVSAKGFHSTAACTGCGKCVKLCSLNNIGIRDGKPYWGQNCTHCMACICGCPSEAIEYKSKSKGKPRYYNAGYRSEGNDNKVGNNTNLQGLSLV